MTDLLMKYLEQVEIDRQWGRIFCTAGKLQVENAKFLSSLSDFKLKKKNTADEDYTEAFVRDDTKVKCYPLWRQSLPFCSNHTLFTYFNLCFLQFDET